MNRIKRNILNYILSHLYNTVTEEEALTSEAGKLWNKGLPLSEEEKWLIVSDASKLQTLHIWPLLLDSLKWEANKKMYISSTCDDDIVAGKWMLYTLDVLEKKVNNLSKLK